MPLGTTVTLTAVADPTSTFNGWTGGGCSGTGTCVVVMNADTAVSASYSQNTATLTVAATGDGGGTVTGAPAGISCGTACNQTVDVGTRVTLTATPDDTSTFAGWSGGGCSGTATCVVTVNAATTVTAAFAVKTAVLTVATSGTGTGSVPRSPARTACGTACSETVKVKTAVTLTATPDPSSTFAGWSGGGCSGTGTCVVTVGADTTVTASFTIKTATLTVTRNGSGTGSVTGSPTGIACGATCSQTVPLGTQVTLTAVPDASSTFGGWGGACNGTAACVVTIGADTAVSATFVIKTATLNVVLAGTGIGGVTSTPAGISCGLACSETVPLGTQVTLTAVSDPLSTFGGWSGACSGTGACVVTVNANTSVTASFALKTATLTVAKSGTGTGTVTSPAGIACGTTCTDVLPLGTLVTLTAVPDATSTFTGWSGGACSGTAPCLVTLGADTTVTAIFTLNTATLTIGEGGTGSGTVASNPAGISCGRACSETVPVGTQITLTAVANASSTFAGWGGGGCSGTGACVVTVGADTMVVASFAAVTETLTVARSGTGTGTVTSSPAGISCGATCSETAARGTQVTLTAAADSSSTFAGWSGGGCSGTGTCAVTLAANTTVTAQFTKKAATLEVSPTLAEVGPCGTVDFSASGGAKPYRWSLLQDRSNASINAKSGVYQAGAETAIDEVEVVDAEGNTATSEVEVGKPLCTIPIGIQIRDICIGICIKL